MSEAAVRGAGWGGVAPRPVSGGADASAEPRRDAPALTSCVFGCLGIFVAAQWARLMIDPPLGRLFLSLAAVCLGGWVLRRIATRGDWRAPTTARGLGDRSGTMFGAAS